MSRLVPYRGGLPAAASAAAVAEGEPHTPVPDRIEAVAKYVPAEILAFYVPAVPAIALLHHSEWKPWLHWAAFLISWTLVPLYFLWIGKGDDRRGRQILVSSIAFPIWAYSTNRTIGPFADYYDDALGVILMLVFSLVTAFILPQRGD